jgi:Raf kinase inhibitor-like YbhB/YbcL family protein
MPSAPAFTVTSPVFKAGQPIPDRFSCKGEDVSPPLEIRGAPRGTQSLALILDDPDAPGGTWTHWTAWDLPPTVATIAEGTDLGKLGARQGVTSAGSIGYHGPCPPSGTHRYFFRIYALRSKIGLKEGATRPQLEAAMAPNMLAVGELMGTFARA